MENVLRGLPKYWANLGENISRRSPVNWAHLMENISKDLPRVLGSSHGEYLKEADPGRGLISWRTSQGVCLSTGLISWRTSQRICPSIGLIDRGLQ